MLHISPTYEFFAFLAVIILIIIILVSWSVNNTSLPPNNVLSDVSEENLENQ